LGKYKEIKRKVIDNIPYNVIVALSMGDLTGIHLLSFLKPHTEAVRVTMYVITIMGICRYWDCIGTIDVKICIIFWRHQPILHIGKSDKHIRETNVVCIHFKVIAGTI
jgi:hypothetical protein